MTDIQTADQEMAKAFLGKSQGCLAKDIELAVSSVLLCFLEGAYPENKNKQLIALGKICQRLAAVIEETPQGGGKQLN